MEIVINKRTYILKSVNTNRREAFLQFALPYYENNERTNEQDIQFAKNVCLSVWSFLKDEDKKEIGLKDNLGVEVSELENFISWILAKIKDYNDFVQMNSGEEGTAPEKTETIFAFVAKQFGWTFEYMQEMDELTILKALQEVCKLQKKDDLNKINIESLVGAFSAGSKQAKRKIDEINNEAKSDERAKQMRSQKVEERGEFLSDEQLKNL